jgi:hypothetical protein
MNSEEVKKEEKAQMSDDLSDYGSEDMPDLSYKPAKKM